MPLHSAQKRLETAPPDDAVAGLRHLAKNSDFIIKPIDINRVEKLSFFIDDIPYYIAHKKAPGAQGSRVSIQAILGYLPFSAESGEKRQAILTILADTHHLARVRFGVDHQGRIYAAGQFDGAVLTAPDFMFFPLSLFLQEAQPFMRLIGNYL